MLSVPQLQPSLSGFPCSQLNYNDPYWSKMVLSRCSWTKSFLLHWGSGSQKIRWRNEQQGSLFSFLSTFFEYFLIWFNSNFNPLQTSSISPHSWDIGTLGRASPTGFVGRAGHWLTHSVPSGFTGWHKDVEQSWVRSAGRLELQTHAAIDYREEVITEERWVV